MGAPGKPPMNSWGSTPGKLKEHGAAGSVLGLAPPPQSPMRLQTPTQHSTLHPPCPSFVRVNAFALWGTFCPFIHYVSDLMGQSSA